MRGVATLLATHVDGEARVPRGLLYWETIATYELEAYRRAWSGVSMEQLNAEVVVIAHHLSLMIRTKYVSLGRLYWREASARCERRRLQENEGDPQNER